MRKSWSGKKITDRGRIFLSASLGEISVREACKKLGMTRQRFYELEERAMRGFFQALEPKAPGRPRKEKDPTEPLVRKVEEMERENKKLWLYVKVLRSLAGIGEGKKSGRVQQREIDVENRRLIVETGREIQSMGSDLMKYLNVIDLAPSTYGWWARSIDDGTMVEKPDPRLSAEQVAAVKEIRYWLRDHAMNERSTYGLRSLWARFRDKICRELYRKIAEEVRLEVNRELRNMIQRYEFNYPDVAHSLDFKRLPKDGTNWRLRYLIRVFDDCTRLTLRKAITYHKGAGVGLEFVWKHLRETPNPLAFKYDWEFVTV